MRIALKYIIILLISIIVLLVPLIDLLEYKHVPDINYLTITIGNIGKWIPLYIIGGNGLKYSMKKIIEIL